MKEDGELTPWQAIEVFQKTGSAIDPDRQKQFMRSMFPLPPPHEVAMGAKRPPAHTPPNAATKPLPHELISTDI